MNIPRTTESRSADYQLRLLTQADAAGVRDLALRVNGPGYLHKEVFDPVELLRLNTTKEVITAVALDRNDRVVGQYALMRPGLAEIAETGQAMVLTEHRGHGLIQRLRALLEDEAGRLNLLGLRGQPVTHHVLTQKVYEQFGCRTTGLQLGLCPASAFNLGDTLSQRVSLLTNFKYLRQPDAAKLYISEHHQDIVRRIFEQLGRTIELLTPRPSNGLGQVRVAIQPAFQLGAITVLTVGDNSAAQVTQALHQLLEQGALAVFLELPCADAGSPELCVRSEAEGLFFSGISPGGSGTADLLILEFLAAPLDESLVRILSPFAQEIKTYVASERRRVGREVGP